MANIAKREQLLFSVTKQRRSPRIFLQPASAANYSFRFEHGLQSAHAHPSLNVWPIGNGRIRAVDTLE